MSFQPNLKNAIDKILNTYPHISSNRSMLIALSGIDGCGKGYIANQMLEILKGFRLNTIIINGDGWLNLPPKRFNSENPAQHFYENGFRFEEMFTELVIPFKKNRFIDKIINFTEETANEYRQHHYKFENVDIILLEAIYLLQSAFIPYYDLSFWIDCSFDTALERALSRNQEGLSLKDTIKAYQTIFFPAQEIHFQQDYPQKLASGIILNDSKI